MPLEKFRVSLFARKNRGKLGSSEIVNADRGAHIDLLVEPKLNRDPNSIK